MLAKAMNVTCTVSYNGGKYCYSDLESETELSFTLYS